MKLRTRIFLPLLLVALLPMAIAGYLIYSQMEQDQRNQAIDRMQNAADVRIQMASFFIHEARSDLAFMRHSLLLHQAFPILDGHIDQPDSPAFRKATAGVQALFRRIHDIYGYGYIMLVDHDGRLLCVDGTDLTGLHIGQPVPDTLNDIPKKIGTDIYQSPTILNERTGHYHLLMAAQVSNEHGQRIGTLLLSIEVLDILKKLQTLPSLGKTGEVLFGIQTDTGLNFMTPLRFRHGTVTQAMSQPMRWALQGKSGTGYARDYRGKEVLAAWQPVPDTNWGMVLKIDVDEARASIVHMRNIILVIMLLAGLLAATAAFHVADSVIRPIGRIRQASEIIGSGNLEHRIGSKESDEFGELSRSMDDMSEKLKKTMEEHGRLVGILDATPDLVGMADMNGMLFYLNPAGHKLIGLDTTKADLPALSLSELHPEQARRVLLDKGIPGAVRDGAWTRETMLLTRDGKEIPVTQTLLSHKGPDGQHAYLSTTMHDLRMIKALESTTKQNQQELVAINQDLEDQIKKNREITQSLERKMAEDDKTRQAMLLMLDDLNASNDETRKANRALTLLSRCNTALIHADTEEGFLAEICNLAVKSGGYTMAWIGFAEHDAARTVRPVAQAGVDKGYLEKADISWADTERGHGPTGTAIRTGVPAISQDLLNDPNTAPWHGDAERLGYRSGIALPIAYRGHMLGSLNLYAAELNAFGKEEIDLLIELSNEIAYGIEALRTRMAHEQHAVIMRQSLEQSIQAIADTVEARDPYTAGHQRNVAELAVAIAQEMKLSEEKIHGIRLAAIIHDLGKIHIPAEILSKPGKLTNIEYQMIRTHPQEGYNIIKGIKFPWPVADMILQHHERLDGSGYPQGLKGSQILPESMIIAVADVVEAMSSHRPYRGGLGLDVALAEIEKNRGLFYDPATVDACIRLFRERGFSLPAHSSL